jgi:RNA polymerase sigma-70 factor (ECF subfamily)
MLESREVAEEILQEVFLQVYRSLHTYRPEKAAFSTWLHRITMNHCLNRKRRGGFFVFSLDRTKPGVPAQNIPLEGLTSGDDSIQQGLRRLSAKLRAVIVLRFYWELSYADTAQILGIPLGTVKSRLDQALKTLRKELDGCEAGVYPLILSGQSSLPIKVVGGGSNSTPNEEDVE